MNAKSVKKMSNAYRGPANISNLSFLKRLNLTLNVPRCWPPKR